MIRIAQLLAVVLFSIGLAGCVTVENQPFNKEAHAGIKTIVILPAPAVADYSINILHHPGMSFGLIGGLVAAAELGSKGSQFTSSMQEQKFDAAKTLTEAVKSEMEQRGYNVIVLNELSRPDGKLLSDYASIPVKGDAYLDFVVGVVGYSANSHSTPYYPTLSAPVRLVDAKDQAIVYNSLIVYGPYGGPKGATRLTPDGSFAMGNFTELQASPSRSVEGIRSAIQAIAKQIASDL
jgi:hypothetical protein